jgi:hypothetical protein
MIGDKRYTEALEDVLVRQDGLVGERSERIEAEGEPTVECSEVRMQT